MSRDRNSDWQISSNMPTLAQTLGTTAPVSPLLRKARRLGIRNLRDAINLAVARGCRHYADGAIPLAQDCGRDSFSNEELSIFLLLGENPYDPAAIRCAAQLTRSPDIEPARLGRLALQHGAERPLAHIAHAGAKHDQAGRNFWIEILTRLDRINFFREEPALPHWSRFVSSPGYQRGQTKLPTWLNPAL